MCGARVDLCKMGCVTVCVCVAFGHNGDGWERWCCEVASMCFGDADNGGSAGGDRMGRMKE